METVIAAVILIFVVLFAVLTLSNAFMTAQTTLHVSWEEMAVRTNDQAQTKLVLVKAETAHNGTVMDVTLRNDGATKLTDFDRWDFIVEYYDANTPAGLHLGWMPYSDSAQTNQWTVKGLYLNAEQGTPEVFEPGILNPGEEIVLEMPLSPAVAAGAAVQALVSPLNGKSTSTVFTGNLLPVLDQDNGLSINAGDTRGIPNLLLKTIDGDDPAANLTYSITTPPAHGTLNLGAQFTQADIDSGVLTYAHNGTASDSFQFTVSDGKDTIGTYTFTIAVNLPPVLATNTGLDVATNGTAAIGDLLLKATDDDNTADQLVYTVTVPPIQGVLSMGNHFTQADIDNGALSYTHTGSGPDSFQFSVSDGKATIGTYTFTIKPY